MESFHAKCKDRQCIMGQNVFVTTFFLCHSSKPKATRHGRKGMEKENWKECISQSFCFQDSPFHCKHNFKYSVKLIPVI